MKILTTIIPIFAVILLGWIARRRGFIPPEFLGPANRLVFYIAIPAMVFRAISKGSLKNNFDPELLGVTIAAIIVFYILAWGLGLLLRIDRRRFGTFIQTSFHGNLGYIGLAVAYYFLGNEGFTSASILTGFIMILQNFLAVFVLLFYSDNASAHISPRAMFWKITGNPVILSAMAGILFSLTGFTLPLVAGRTLDIVSGMSLPLALLLIGASLNFSLMKSSFAHVTLASLMKLMLLPGLGLMLYRISGMAPTLYVPGLILLASPSATISYVMAREMNGDADFAVAAISACTLLSSLTFSLWLNIARHFS